MNPKLLGSLLVGIIVLTGVYIGSLSLSQNPLTRESLESQQAQVSSALTNGLISHWKFDEGSGNSVSSAVGGASDTLGSPVWIDGKIGKALTFNGSDYVSAGDISQSKITISAWIKPESNSNFGSIAMKQNVYGLESQGAKVFARVGDGSSWTGSVEAPISFGVWQLVTQTFDGSKVRIYVNGSLVATANAKVTLGSTVPFLIGTWATDFSEPFKGGVDDVRVYNRALSASEVSALYAYNGTTTPPPATDTTAPIISNVSSTNLKQTEATVTWTTNEASDTYVEFGLTPAYGNTSAVKDLGSAMVTSHTQTLVSLATNTTYNYRVTSKDAAGNSAVSGNYTFTTSPVPDTTAPTVPTAVTASNITQTSATISWTASTDAIGVTGYDVYRNGSKVGTATGASYNDSGLSANTKYSYTVTAFDAAGNTSAQSIAASVTTLANAPTVSLSATVASITSGQSTILNWSSTNATACTATGGTFAGQKGPSGSQTVYPTVTSTYGISCTGTGGTTSATPVTITVAAPEVSSLVSYWALNQTSGSTATDSSGNNKTATLVGGPVWTTGVAGNGLQFNGTSAYVNAGTVSLSSFTISAWVNMSSSQSGWGSIVMKQNSFGLEVQNGTVYANIGNGATWNNTVSTPLTAGAWKHVVQTYDGTTNRIYVDGVLKASGTGAFTNASSNLLIGSWNTTSEFFNGKIDEVQVYNKALTSTEVQSLYTSIVPPTNPTPTTYTVTVAKAGTGSGTVTSTGSINCGATCSSTGDAGQTVTLTAAPAAGSSFAGWTGVTSCSTSATCSFVLNSNITATATFNTVVAGTFTITTAKAGTGSGTVTCAPTTCTANTGSAVTVTAAAASGSTFVGWSGACTGTGACSLTSAGNVTATFNTIPVTGGTVFYIREGATGNGTDWTNAYGSFPPTLVRGATYYVADGVYAAYNFDDAVNGTQLITIKKAIQSDHGTDTGWATTYGDGRAQLGALTFSTDYYVIDGQKGSGSTNLADRDYGFYIKSGGTIISSDGSANYITIKRTEIEGTGRDGGTAADTTWPSNKGFFLSGTHTNWTMSQIYLHDTGNMSFQWASLSNSIIDKSYIARNESTAAAHAEGVYGFGSGNVISNNVWEDIEGTGVVMISGNNWKIYNNVMFWTTAYTGEGTGNGAVGDWSDSSTGSSASNNLIYSNTIINQKGYSSGFNFIHTGSTGNVASNNLRYLASSGSNTTGTNNITATVDPFVNWQARDFRLNSSSSAINAGATLGSEYASDLIGTPRPQGSAFDAGAYEFTGTVTTPTTPNSVKFAVNDRVASTDILNVRSNPSSSATLLGAQALGALGTINANASNGVFADGYYWWNINYDAGVDGWSVENYLVKYTPPTTPTPTGTTFYITPAGAGAKNGADWNNAMAWSSFTPSRGATYYVAGGSYSGRDFATAVSGSSYITIKKAIASDHGTDTGWVSTYGTTQASITGVVSFNTDYWIIDGSIRNESDWFDATSYGFRISGSQQQIYVGKNSSYIQVKNLVFEQPATLETAAVRRYSLDLYSFGGYPKTQQGIVVARSYFKNGNVPIFAGRTTNEYISGMLVEYTAFDNTKSNANNHGEAISCYYNGCGKDFVIRFNKFRGISGTAIIAMTGADNFQFYGNVIWNSDIGDGILGFSEPTRSNFTNSKVFNNTIVDRVSGWNEGVAFQTGSNNLVYNNLWFNTSQSNGATLVHGGGVTNNYNAYDDSSYTGTEPNIQKGLTSAIFNGYTADDFTLKVNTAAGIDLSKISGYVSAWSQDITGKTRSTWSRGAYEYN